MSNKNEYNWSYDITRLYDDSAIVFKHFTFFYLHILDVVSPEA